MNCIARELVVKIKILVILAMSFAVLSCKKRAVLTDPGGPKDHEHPGQEMQAYPKFEFAYKAWLVAASDGGVIGISVELYNLSGNTPLKLRSAGDCIPIGVVIRDRNNPLGKGLVGVGGIKLHSAPATTVAQPSEKKPNVIWAIPPVVGTTLLYPAALLLQ